MGIYRVVCIVDKSEYAYCDECGSEFLRSCSKMAELCPECSHLLYGHPNCERIFKNGRCIYCYWDGSRSEYTGKLLKNC